MLNINALVKDAFNGLDKLFTSDEERDQYVLAVQKLEQNINAQLLERNKAVALISWIGRWPDAIGWLLFGALIVDLIMRPLFIPFGINIPDLDETKLMGFAGTLLGIRGIGAAVEIKKG